MRWKTIKYYWENREIMNVSLNTLYQAIGTTKQAVHKRLNKELKEQAYFHQLLCLIHEIRKDHPTMGCRDMYYCIKPDFMGRDKFEVFCKENGFASKRVKKYARTTDSRGVIRFPNLTIDFFPSKINQLWVSDITYFEIGGKFYYITFIMDAFSRRIIGHNASERLFTSQTSLAALKMAKDTRKKSHFEGTIFHSDGGGQYYDNQFLAKTESMGLYNSMCEFPWDNGKAERINGVIKNNYLKHWNISNFKELKESVDRAVQLYNEEKPHIELKRLSPIQFENLYISNGKTSDGEKSTTENENQSRKTASSPSAFGKTSSGSNITQEYENDNNLVVT